MSTHDLFTSRPIVWLVKVANGVENINMPTNGNDSDFKVYKGQRNNLEFIIRDNDRKPVVLNTGIALNATIVNMFNDQVMLQKQLTVVDATNGRARLVIESNETTDWIKGYYYYSITITNTDTTVDFLFHDRDQRAKGFLEVFEGLTPPPDRAIEVQGNTFTAQSVGNPAETRYFSGAVTADNQLSLSDGIHSVAAYFTNFSGKFWIQATLLNTPTTVFTDWFDIDLSSGSETNDTLSSFSGIKNYNFTINAQWIRFVYFPEMTNSGNLDKVLLKN